MDTLQVVMLYLTALFFGYVFVGPAFVWILGL